LMSLHGGLHETQATGKLLRRMSRDHVDVLQNIESTLLSAYEKDGSIDDRIIAEVLQAAIRDEIPDGARAQSIHEDLEEMRHLRADVPDKIWRDGLRTVLQSVQRHSNLRPGERNYLNFVSDFIF
jgi:hypothetical protein